MATTNNGKVALVTGAGRGLGRAIALQLARDGYSLVLAARTGTELEETRKQSGLSPERALLVPVDLAHANGPNQLAKAALDRFGRIDVLINNAAVSNRGELIKVAEENQDRVINLNFRAPVALTRLLAPKMIEAGGGAIINIASGTIRNRVAGATIYIGTKAGLLAFTRECFYEMRETGIRFCCVVQGLTDTSAVGASPLLDRNKMIKPESSALIISQIIHGPAEVVPLEIDLIAQREPGPPAWRAIAQKD